MTTLEQQFEDALMDDVQIVVRATRGRYNPTWFVEMLYARHGVGTARHLIADPIPQSGLDRLWHEGQRCHEDLLQYSLEARMLMPEYRTLFTKAELDTAYDRLDAYEYCPPWAKNYKRHAV